MSETKSKLFTRKHPKPGVWATNYEKKTYKLADREILEVSNPKLIKILKEDPEIKEYQPETDVEAPMPFDEMDVERLKQEAAKRKIDISGMSKSGELIDALKKYDKENSKKENDQGE